MTYPNPGVLKAAMGHYLTESARTALEAMEPEEDVIEVSGGGKTAVEPTLFIAVGQCFFSTLATFKKCGCFLGMSV